MSSLKSNEIPLLHEWNEQQSDDFYTWHWTIKDIQKWKPGLMAITSQPITLKNSLTPFFLDACLELATDFSMPGCGDIFLSLYVSDFQEPSSKKPNSCKISVNVTCRELSADLLVEKKIRPSDLVQKKIRPSNFLQKKIESSKFPEIKIRFNIVNNAFLCKIQNKDNKHCDSEEYLNDIHMNLCVRVTQCYGDEFENVELEKPLHPLLNDITKMFDSNEFADVTFEIGSEVLKAHKFILVTRSPYFHALFSSGMSETQTNTIKVHDITLDCFKEVLCYMYKGEISNKKHATLDLAEAAEIYQLLNLRDFCENYQEKNVSRETAAKLFLYGCLKNKENLSNRAVKYIVENKASFFEDELAPLFDNPAFCRIIFFNHSK